MANVAPLPSKLEENYKSWKGGRYAETAERFQDLAKNGQKPFALLITCCDSRVDAAPMLGIGPGDLFMHRNIANIVPAHNADGGMHATSAVLEYAVTALKVPHIIVMGHSQCGGVQGCHAMCKGDAPKLRDSGSFVGQWITAIEPAFDQVTDLPEAEQLPAMEKAAVTVSLDNLMTFPFVKAAVERCALELHGLWTDVGTGDLEALDPTTGAFTAV